MMSDEQITGAVFLALVLFGFFLWLISNMTTKIFTAIGHMFEAIGSATISFFGMAWILVQFAGILAIGVLLIYAAYKFIVLVKSGTEIMKQVETKLAKQNEQITQENTEVERKLSRMVHELSARLDEALMEPEVVPEAPKAAEEEAPLELETVEAKESNEQVVSVTNRY